MFFTSLEFAIFFALVFGTYWFLLGRNIRSQNLFLIVASYVFYGWWDWRFLGLIIVSSFVDFVCGIAIGNSSSKKTRRRFLFLSLFVNLGMLGVFKYYNFFVDSMVSGLADFGVEAGDWSLSVILPVGISFYTFQTLSYTIDVYRDKIQPEKDWAAFFAYVSFFPQLVAGPIERATQLLPQFSVPRKFEYDLAIGGTKQIIWGFFKKIVIADNCGVVVDEIFSNYSELSPPVLMLGAIYFAFQIYGDFSGYSDIAIGTSKLLGFRLMTNFRYPYFSRDIAEFWRRWHISLSTWFRDYVYIPLGGSQVSRLRAVRNVFIVFLVSGLWHGANWTFVSWGLINAAMFLPLLLMDRNRKHLDSAAQGRLLPSMGEAARMATTFFFVCLAWIFFRADDMNHAFAYLNRLTVWSDVAVPAGFLWMLIPIVCLVVFEWINREFPVPEFRFKSSLLNHAGYFLLVYVTSIMARDAQPFIYFQF